MQPFERATLPPHAFDPQHYIDLYKVSREAAEDMAYHMRNDVVWLNNIYQVNVSDLAPEDNPEMWHLSIKRRDRRVIRDWRVLQEIKNLIVGPEHEGVELFPAESRLVDTANQYHLYVLKDPTIRFPFGFQERMLATSTEAARTGAKQRDRT